VISLLNVREIETQPKGKTLQVPPVVPGKPILTPLTPEVIKELDLTGSHGKRPISRDEEETDKSIWRIIQSRIPQTPDGLSGEISGSGEAPAVEDEENEHQIV
jgi:hypothetical protein